MFKKPTTSIIFHIILIFTVIISMKSCIAKGNDPDAIYSLKNSRFSSYGSQTLETAAKDSLTDLQWICSEEPISFDGGYVYEAALSGHSEEHDLDVSIGFTVTLGYRVKKHDPVPVTISIDWVQVGDIYSEEVNDISYVMDFIYGNL